jgi:hypothetical protein
MPTKGGLIFLSRRDVLDITAAVRKLSVIRHSNFVIRNCLGQHLIDRYALLLPFKRLVAGIAGRDLPLQRTVSLATDQNPAGWIR